MIKKLLVAAMFAASLGGISTSASAQVDVYLNFAPPAPRYEAVPAPRRGYVWAPGYWDWRGNRHVWVAGHWEAQRAGYYYNTPQWVQRDGRWHLQRGQWNRGDRDRDGVPNRFDRDRDGDGVPNNRDRAPDNPRRQ